MRLHAHFLSIDAKRLAFVVVINRTYRSWGVGAILQGRLLRTIRLDGCEIFATINDTFSRPLSQTESSLWS